MEKLISADEAKIKSRKNYERITSIDNLYEKAIDCINSTISSGNFECQLYSSTDFYFDKYPEQVEPLRRKLEEKGYKTKYIDKILQWKIHTQFGYMFQL
jgi:hypothetical protein